jgi:2-octaprenyl-6-methoxyphenol hydroxylase
MEQRDIVIAGGGMVGLSLALLLAARLPQPASIALVEGYPLPQADDGQVPEYHPSFDARATALSHSSRLIYQRAGVWEDLARWLCPIATIHVSTSGRFGSTLMDAAEYGWPALGYVVDNAWLGRALLAALRRQGRVELINPARVTRVESDAAGARLALEGGPGRLRAGLLVVADGAGSGLRDQLGVPVREKTYGQRALVASVATALNHRGCAFERFTASGPLALLPLLPAPQARNRSSLVWTLPPERARYLAGCPEQEFLGELQRAFGYRLGRLLKVGERHSYPLSLMHAAEQVRRGVAVAGNAAHALHPVAGQGFNLALRDLERLSEAVGAALAQGLPAGDLATLQGYYRAQQPDQQRTIAFSDALPGLFMRGDPVIGLARDLALSGLDIVPPLKRQFVRYAAGVGGSGHA